MEFPRNWGGGAFAIAPHEAGGVGIGVDDDVVAADVEAVEIPIVKAAMPEVEGCDADDEGEGDEGGAEDSKCAFDGGDCNWRKSS
jgi:hypothetical protein